MTQWSVKGKGLYYRPNTDHFFPKYRPNTDQFFQYFSKIQTIIIFVSINVCFYAGVSNGAYEKNVNVTLRHQHTNISPKSK